MSTRSRRSLFGSAGALALLGTLPAASAGQAGTSPIMVLARRLGELDAEHHAADLASLRGEPGARETCDRLHYLIGDLEEEIMEATPTDVADAAVILMYASGEICIGNSSANGKEIVEYGEEIVRLTALFLGNLAKVDFAPLGGSRYRGFDGRPVRSAMVPA